MVACDVQLWLVWVLQHNRARLDFNNGVVTFPDASFWRGGGGGGMTDKALRRMKELIWP